MIDRPLVHGRNTGTVVCPVGSASSIVARAWVNVRCDGGARVRLWFQRSADTHENPPGAGAPVDQPIAHSRRGSWPVPDGTEYVQFVIDCGGAGALCVEMAAK